MEASLLASLLVSLSRLARFCTAPVELLRHLLQRNTKPHTPASVAITDHTYLDILNDFEPDDESTALWLDFIASDPDARASTLDFLELCLEHE